MKEVRKRSRLFCLTLAASATLLAMISLACSQKPSGENQEGAVVAQGDLPNQTTIEVPTFTVAKGDVVRNLIFTGEVRAARSVEISLPRIRSSFNISITYLAPEGEVIKKGDLVVEFDSSNLVSQQSEAERKLAETKLNIAKKKADLEAQRCDLLDSIAQEQANLKIAELYGKISKELLPANTYQQYQVDLDKARLSLQKAEEQLANFEKNYDSEIALVEINQNQAEVDLKKINNDIADLSIKAPQDGIVIYGDNPLSNRKFQVGDNIFPTLPVVMLPDLSSMQVVGFVHDTEYPSLSRGMRCNISLDAVADYQVQGEIVSLTNVAIRKGYATEQMVFNAVVQPDKVDVTVMKPQMTARVEVPIKLAADVVTTPREYIGLDGEHGYFVMSGSDPKMVSKKYVEVGALGDQVAQILSGIELGDVLFPVQGETEVVR